jgi:phage host-nuclease inhibitor protein Gam
LGRGKRRHLVRMVCVRSCRPGCSNAAGFDSQALAMYCGGMLMGRPRKAKKKLGTLDECQEAMRLLKLSAIEQERLEGARDKAIAGITEKYAGEITAAADAVKDLTLQLQNYYMTHLADLESEGKKSVRLRHGVMGRRLGSPALRLVNKSWSWASALVKLREKWGDRFIRTADPEVKKDEVKKADLEAADLRECGLKIDQDEDFYAEPDRGAEEGGTSE